MPIRTEHDRLVVRGKVVGEIFCRVVGETVGFAAGSRDEIDIEVAVAVRSKGDEFAIMAPYRVPIIGVVDGQRGGLAAGGSYFEKVAFVAEGDGFPVRGDGGLLDPAEWVLGSGGEDERKGETE